MKLFHKIKELIARFKDMSKHVLGQNGTESSVVSQFDETQQDLALNSETQETKKPKAVAFVDYEYWYYSYQNLFHLSPDVVSWRNKLEEKYSFTDIMVFANFANQKIRQELINIRKITNFIIETQQIMADHEKDMTDFIMLDYVYRYVSEHPEADTYVLFTGDAHFQEAIKYLIYKHNKKVIAYGVKNSFSTQVKQIASEAIELPVSEEIYPLIVDNMAYVSTKWNIVPTFTSTAKTISRRNNLPEEFVKLALKEMLDKGLLYSHKQRVAYNQFVPVLAANWENLEHVGLWTY